MSKDLKILDIVDDPIQFYNDDEIIYDGVGIIDYTFIPNYKSNYHKVEFVENAVEVCKKEGEQCQIENVL